MQRSFTSRLAGLAISSGLFVIGFCTIAPVPAAAQITGPLPIDTVEDFIARANNVARRARTAETKDRCQFLLGAADTVREIYDFNYDVLPPEDAAKLRQHTQQLRRELQDEGLTCRSRQDAAAVTIGGGVTSVDISQVKGGTQFDPITGTEIPIANSANRLTGGGGNFFLSIPIPTNQNILWGDYFFVDASGSQFDGSGNGSVPIGGNNVAFTYIFPNPISDSTGIFAGPTGQQVRIGSDGHLIDISFGLKDVTPLPGPPAGPGSPFIQRFDLQTTAGFRYRNFDVSHTISQQSLFFPDLNSHIGLDQSSNFFGAQFGVGLISRPPGPQGGFVGGIHAFVAPGILSTSLTANQVSHCGPCGIASPEFDVSLQRDFNDSRFSVIVGGTVHLGYQFSPNVGVFVKGTVEHMTDVPFFQVPTTPAEQPIYIDHGAVTNASAMAGFRVAFDPQAFQTVP